MPQPGPAHPALPAPPQPEGSLSWVLHVGTGKYDYVGGHLHCLLGYAPEAFTTGGIEFTRRLLHPADAGNLEKLKNCVEKFLLAVPPRQRVGYQCNYDYRLRKSDGTYLRLLEQSTVVDADARGEITHLATTCIDITHWKKDEVLTATVVSPAGDTCLVCTSADGEVPKHLLPSKREKEILALVAAGHTSQESADRLFISLHTVNTHRRNLARKTNAKTDNGLVRYAVTNQG
jgi:DNA-binding CsgD family transcriptional regulator